MQLEIFEAKKKKKKRQREEMASIGCVGEASSMPPYSPSASATISISASASASGSATASIGPRVRKSRMDSYFEPHTTPDAQPLLERFWYYCTIPFFAAR